MSLRAVRERCELIYSAAVKGDGGLKYFTVDEELLKSRAAPEIIALIERDYNDGNRISCDTDMIEVAKKIPPHGRWRHFAPFSFKIGRGLEYARILVDLFVVAVLLDAGTGGTWSFKDSKFINQLQRFFLF